jgi:hypothetical protein
MAEDRAAARSGSRAKVRPDGGRVRALCAQVPGNAESSSPPGRVVRAKLLLRKRRIGDLNPGGWLHPTALAVCIRITITWRGTHTARLAWCGSRRLLVGGLADLVQRACHRRPSGYRGLRHRIPVGRLHGVGQDPSGDPGFARRRRSVAVMPRARKMRAASSIRRGGATGVTSSECCAARRRRPWDCVTSSMSFVLCLRKTGLQAAPAVPAPRAASSAAVAARDIQPLPRMGRQRGRSPRSSRTPRHSSVGSSRSRRTEHRRKSG